MIIGNYFVYYLEAFMQLYDTIKQNNYDLDLNKKQLQRLESLYNEALEKLDPDKVRYNKSLSDDLKLKLMFKTNKVYNVEDLSILYDYYQEHYNQTILANNPTLILSDEFKFYLLILVWS